ncbi:hypothetical protein PINS_up021329 [Pythium insidiosum]|nr:hypothetical protein PINS_up021329 [Pythium insidiosum]
MMRRSTSAESLQSPPTPRTKRRTSSRKSTTFGIQRTGGAESPEKDGSANASSPSKQSASNNNNGNGGGSSSEDTDIFPQWIRERKDFQVFFPRYADRVITDDEILRQGVPKEPSERNIVELQCLARWIMKIPSMQSLDLSQATEIAKLARYQVFKPRDYVFRKGDKGDACYLIFTGEVNVLIDGQKVATVGKNAAFGDIALQIENATRGADVQAAFNPSAMASSVGSSSSNSNSGAGFGGVEVLKILAEDYHKTLARCQSRRRKHLISWLHTEVVLFRDCVESKLHFFELVSIDVPLKKDEVLYQQGDSIGAFYVVRSGRVRLEVDIQYQHKHRWPTGTREWKEEVRAIKSRVPFHAEESAGFFGFEMFVEGMQSRAYTVIADSPSVELVALNRVDCFSPYFSFTPRAIERILEKHNKCREASLRQIHDKLKDFHRMASQQKRPCKPIDRLPLIVQPKFAGSSETPQFQFPCLQASKWEAPNQVVRALQQACE